MPSAESAPSTPPSPAPAAPGPAVPASGALHASWGTRRRLRVGGPVLIVAGLVAAAVRPGTPVAWALLAAGAALAWAGARTTSPDAACAFCGAGRDQVPFLITGTSVSICPECATGASARTAEELDRRGELAEWSRMFLAGLPERASVALSRPHVEAVVGDDRSPEWVRAALACCFRFGHHRLGQALLEAIPEAERTALDWINLGIALGEQGDLAGALAATRRAAAVGDGAEEPWVLANTAWCELRLRPDAPREDLSRWLAQVVEARRALSSRVAPGTEGTETTRHALASFRGVEAELLRRLGDAEGALRALDAADAEEPASGERLVVRARALADLGRAADARAQAASALALLRPDARDAAEARRLAEASPGAGA